MYKLENSVCSSINCYLASGIFCSLLYPSITEVRILLSFANYSAWQETHSIKHQCDEDLFSTLEVSLVKLVFYCTTLKKCHLAFTIIIIANIPYLILLTQCICGFQCLKEDERQILRGLPIEIEKYTKARQQNLYYEPCYYDLKCEKKLCYRCQTFQILFTWCTYVCILSQIQFTINFQMHNIHACIVYV